MSLVPTTNIESNNIPVGVTYGQVWNTVNTSWSAFETTWNLQRAFPYIMNLSYDLLDQLVEIKRKGEVEYRNYNSKNYEGKNPHEVQIIIREKYKKILVKEFEKLLKKYKPQTTEVILNAAIDDLANKHKGIK